MIVSSTFTLATLYTMLFVCIVACCGIVIVDMLDSYKEKKLKERFAKIGIL